jgi:hypothetical protein
MSDTLRRIIVSQRKGESPFFKDPEGRIIELTASQGDVYTGYYQADDGTYYTEKDWLEQQRELELQRLVDEEYEAEQSRLKAERVQRDQKKALLAAQQKVQIGKVKKALGARGKTVLLVAGFVAGISALTVALWPKTTITPPTTTPDVTITDTIQEDIKTVPFGNAVIAGKDVRMRVEPNLKGKVITFFPNEGEHILIVQAANDTLLWTRVRRENGTEGWVFRDYVKEK